MLIHQKYHEKHLAGSHVCVRIKTAWGVCVSTYASEHASYVFVSLYVTQACCDIIIANSQDSHFCHH